ncbi:hypothetical protein Tdes44962_MAKER07071 [Teratosphaeria destructans]|uniref:Uncharacterized protein n=1 Tax=Teratosphaeria destructans TaxID=418781 RepID=A0A9W7T082_9PEZI|nr:hypothetical protein Tdes44962_MAKER07071 [Teratosphaeria destructans]
MAPRALPILPQTTFMVVGTGQEGYEALRSPAKLCAISELTGRADEGVYEYAWKQHGVLAVEHHALLGIFVGIVGTYTPDVIAALLGPGNRPDVTPPQEPPQTPSRADRFLHHVPVAILAKSLNKTLGPAADWTIMSLASTLENVFSPRAVERRVTIVVVNTSLEYCFAVTDSSNYRGRGLSTFKDLHRGIALKDTEGYWVSVWSSEASDAGPASAIEITREARSEQDEPLRFVIAGASQLRNKNATRLTVNSGSAEELAREVDTSDVTHEVADSPDGKISCCVKVHDQQGPLSYILVELADRGRGRKVS